MNQKVLRAFGYIIIQNDWEPGDVFSDDYCVDNNFTITREVDPNLTVEEYQEQEFNHIWLVTSGQLDVVEKSTGRVCVRKAGFCTLDVENQKGELSVRVVEPTQLFCLSANRNLKRTPIIPHVRSLKMKLGEVYVDTVETRLFLAAGELKLGDISIEGPCQLQVSSNQALVAVTDCYGLIFL